MLSVVLVVFWELLALERSDMLVLLPIHGRIAAFLCLALWYG
jgi:hypothetical protein